ncbi:Glucose 1-dehydrogenase [Halioglobus japonicus]|nr:Glucose 1-dehydrogenase [Halioglobus japonicus]
MAEERASKAGRLSGKVAIVSGAAAADGAIGIGAATATLFAREGAKVLLVNRTEANAQRLCDDIVSQGGECAVFIGDVTREDDVQRMVEAALATYGQIDVLHNNAGVGAPGTVVNVKQEVWDNAMKTNLQATMLTCKYSIPHMIASGGGSIINTSTVGAVQGFRRGDVGFAAYAASKAGLIGLTLSIAADYAADGIRANSLVAGMVNTPALHRLGEEARNKRRLAVPLQTEGTPWDVAWAALYLASDEARWVTGASLPVDGGQMNLREWPG